MLQGQRAARIEMLLAHEFHARKFMLPDKLSFRDRERLQRAAGGEDDEEAPAAAGGAPQYTCPLPRNSQLQRACASAHSASACTAAFSIGTAVKVIEGHWASHLDELLA